MSRANSYSVELPPFVGHGKNVIEAVLDLDARALVFTQGRPPY